MKPSEQFNKMRHHADEWFNLGTTSGGAFLTALFDLCKVADSWNIVLLMGTYPIEVAAWVNRQNNNECSEGPDQSCSENGGLIAERGTT